MHTGFVFSIKVCGLRLIHIYSLSIYSSKMLYLGWNHGQQCAFFMTVIKILNIMRLRLLLEFRGCCPGVYSGLGSQLSVGTAKQEL